MYPNRERPAVNGDQASPGSHVEVAIVGAGFSGLGMAMALKESRIEDFVVFERAGDLGGTWRDNTYPGCACDIPSVLYSWSAEQNPSWSRAFAGQEEIWDYMHEVVSRHDLARHIRLNHEVTRMRWDEERSVWEIDTNQGTVTADVAIAAVGALADPAIPRLPGIERFRGRVFHSARWDHGFELSGRQVAVVGTGASAIQFVPEIQPRVGRLHLFQRTPPWVMPRTDPPIPQRWQRRFARHPKLLDWTRRAVFSLLELLHASFRHPALMRLGERRARRHIARQVSDPALREKLTPDYRLGCKRILASDSWYPAISAPNVELVTAGITEVVADGIVDAEGVDHRVDAIIFGTGFRVTDPPIGDSVIGRDGATLAGVWHGSPQAHLGLAVSGFPNFFMLLGPNSGLGHNSVLLMTEAQIAYVRKALQFQRNHRLASIEPRPEAQANWVAEVEHGTEGSVWTAGGCKSWYVDATGRNSTLWPGTVRAYQRRLWHFDPGDYRVELPRPARDPVVA